IFIDPHQNNYGELMGTQESYWNDTRSNLIIKMLSLINIFSVKDFFINTLFYNFLVFTGVTALYLVFIKLFPSSKVALTICIFLMPSALFFSAMIHRDGLILLAISMVIYHLFFMIKQ